MTGCRAIALACCLAYSSAHADITAETAAKARALFEFGQKQIDLGDVEGACVSFATSLQLDPQIGTRLNLADCRERQNRLLDAHQLFVDAAAEAARANKEGRAKYARDRLTALAHKLVRITVRVAQPDRAGLAIKLAGRELPRAQWGHEQIALPGPVVVVASAPDHAPQRLTAFGAAGAEVAIDVPSFDAPAPAPPPGPASEPAPTEPTSPTPHVQRDLVPFYVGGAGGVLLLTSIAVGLRAKSRYDDAFAAGDRARVSSAQTEANVGTGIAIVGAAAIAVGVVLYVRGRHDTDHVVIAPDVSDHGVGIAVAGPL